MKIDKKTVMRRQLQALEKMGIEQLREKFHELFGFETDSINPQAVRRRVAYRIQEIHLGGLSETEEALLDQLADNDPQANLAKQPTRKVSNNVGTMFAREWKGKRYEVIYRGNNQYEYAGVFYRSLTAVATAITGTKWNGRAFFGVK